MHKMLYSFCYFRKVTFNLKWPDMRKERDYFYIDKLQNIWYLKGRQVLQSNTEETIARIASPRLQQGEESISPCQTMTLKDIVLNRMC